MKEKSIGIPSLKELLIIILSALVCTLIMSSLNAYERLYLFDRMYSLHVFAEFAVFFPSFLAIGFVISAIRRIQEFRSEISRRQKAEKALLESEKRYREMSITDALTNLYNSRHFHNSLKTELDRALRYSQPLSLLMLDIDDFKNYNDRYGHMEGDKVLVKIGEAIQSCMRGTDSAYRYGGEEFTVILPETRSEGAIIVAERIREEFKDLAFFTKPEEEAHMTVTIGVARYVPGEDEESFVKRADKNMYAAKKQGKDRVLFSTEGEQPLQFPDP